MHQKKPKLTSLWHALDEASFGTERTLNLRELLPSAAEARSRTEVWLRARQVTKTEEVLIITGRGNQSIGGVGVIRQEILGMMPSLRRRGIVETWREHSPGSIVVTLAPINALLSAPRRRRGEKSREESTPDATSLTGLRPDTIRLLRQLAEQNLDMLGIEVSDAFVLEEMARTFSTFVSAMPNGAAREDELLKCIMKGLEEAGDSK
jgi:hypothetical protein